ncbi:MAG: phosphoribosyltransferase [Methylococcales bacterium]|nr:phosphoribosyltransferase [Methylococcales bacterium]
MHSKLPCTFITWEEVYSLCHQLAQQLRKANFRIDVIVAIARGGYMPARLLSDMLGIHDLDCFKIEHYQGAYKQQEAVVKYPLNADINGRNVLLLDDVCDSGDTFEVGIGHIRHCGAVNELRTAVLHLKTVSRYVPDFYVEEVREWRWLIYPWAVNEDLSSMIGGMQLADADVTLLQRIIKQRHGIDASRPQIEDALTLLQGTEKQ